MKLCEFVGVLDERKEDIVSEEKLEDRIEVVWIDTVQAMSLRRVLNGPLRGRGSNMGVGHGSGGAFSRS